jgi:hypothetical protein
LHYSEKKVIITDNDSSKKIIDNAQVAMGIIKNTRILAGAGLLLIQLPSSICHTGIGGSELAVGIIKNRGTLVIIFKPRTFHQTTVII